MNCKDIFNNKFSFVLGAVTVFEIFIISIILFFTNGFYNEEHKVMVYIAAIISNTVILLYLIKLWMRYHIYLLKNEGAKAVNNQTNDTNTTV